MWKFADINWLLLCPLCFIHTVMSDCRTESALIKSAFEIKEDINEHVFINISSNNDSWRIDVSSVNNEKHLSSSLKHTIMEHFNFSHGNGTLFLALRQALDKESLYNITEKDVDIITLEMVCVDETASPIYIHQVEEVNDLKNGLSRPITKCIPNLTISGFIGDVHLVSHGKVFNEALTRPLPQVTRRPLALQHKQYCKDQLIAVFVEGVDEYYPVFNGAPYHISIPEDLPVGSHIYNLEEHVTDEDIPRDTHFIYAIEPYNVTKIDGSKLFGVSREANGEIILKQALDYEEMVREGINYYIVSILVTDSGGLSANATLNITVTDSDDLGPVFTYPDCNYTTQCNLPSFRTNTTAHYRGVLDVIPKIAARDGDALNYEVLFSLEKQPNGYDGSFHVNTINGELTQVGDVMKSGILVIKARENSTKQHAAIASILVILTNEINSTYISDNNNFTQTSFKGSGISLKAILIIVSASCTFVILSLMVGLCIQHRHYIKTSRPVQNLSYLYVRSFKRQKADTDQNKHPDEQNVSAQNNSFEANSQNASEEPISLGGNATGKETQNYATLEIKGGTNIRQEQLELHQLHYCNTENTHINEASIQDTIEESLHYRGISRVPSDRDRHRDELNFQADPNIKHPVLTSCAAGGHDASCSGDISHNGISYRELHSRIHGTIQSKIENDATSDVSEDYSDTSDVDITVQSGYWNHGIINGIEYNDEKVFV